MLYFLTLNLPVKSVNCSISFIVLLFVKVSTILVYKYVVVHCSVILFLFKLFTVVEVLNYSSLIIHKMQSGPNKMRCGKRYFFIYVLLKNDLDNFDDFWQVK